MYITQNHAPPCINQMEIYGSWDLKYYAVTYYGGTKARNHFGTHVLAFT